MNIQELAEYTERPEGRAPLWQEQHVQSRGGDRASLKELNIVQGRGMGFGSGGRDGVEGMH